MRAKFVPFHSKNLPKGRNVTYLEDPGIVYSALWGVAKKNTFFCCAGGPGETQSWNSDILGSGPFNSFSLAIW